MRAVWHRPLRPKPKSANEPVFEPRRSLHCSAPKPGLGNRDREGGAPHTPVLLPAGGFRSEGRASGGNSDRKAKELFPETTGIKQTDRGSCSLYRRIGD